MSKKGLVIGLVAVTAVIGGGFIAKSTERIPDGYVAVQYTTSGAKDKVLNAGWHFINPLIKTKEFPISDEQFVLSKTKKEDTSFKVSTSDDANISIGFQMTYNYIPEKVVSTYKRFRGMDGEDIVEMRVKNILKSKISEVTANYSLMDIYSGDRTKINNEIKKCLKDSFSDKFGINVTDASIIDAYPDKKLKESIDARVKALQEKQQAEAEQEKVKVQKETEKMQAAADAEIVVTKAKAEAEANRLKSESVTDELIRMKEAEAHMKHGFVTVQGANTVVKE